jgi:hypothetical protein
LVKYVVDTVYQSKDPHYIEPLLLIKLLLYVAMVSVGNHICRRTRARCHRAKGVAINGKKHIIMLVLVRSDINDGISRLSSSHQLRCGYGAAGIMFETGPLICMLHALISSDPSRRYHHPPPML